MAFEASRWKGGAPSGLFTDMWSFIRRRPPPLMLKSNQQSHRTLNSARHLLHLNFKAVPSQAQSPLSNAPFVSENVSQSGPQPQLNSTVLQSLSQLRRFRRRHLIYQNNKWGAHCPGTATVPTISSWAATKWHIASDMSTTAATI